MRILLDTQVLVAVRARRLLTDPETVRLVSAVSGAEIAIAQIRTGLANARWL